MNTAAIDKINNERSKMNNIFFEINNILYSLNDPKFSKTTHIEAEELRELIKVVALTRLQQLQDALKKKKNDGDTKDGDEFWGEEEEK